MTQHSTPSTFALALRRLLDETEYFDRCDWAVFLGVPSPAISRWLTDKAVPRADLLRMILDALRSIDTDASSSRMMEFDLLSNLPATSISPLGERMSPTVSDYLKNSTVATLGQELRKLSPEQQRIVLAEGSWGPASEAEVEYEARILWAHIASRHSIALKINLPAVEIIAYHAVLHEKGLESDRAHDSTDRAFDMEDVTRTLVDTYS